MAAPGDVGPRGGLGNSPSEAASLTLLVVRGPYVGRQIQISAGNIVRIGRTNRSDQAFPNDTYLSGAHFEVDCDERECRIRDLGSSNGTFVNGAKIELATVQEGDQIAAGESVFLVQAADEEQVAAPLVQGVAPADAQLPAVERTARTFAPEFEPKPQEPLAPLSPERKRALHILARQGVPLFAVLDAARDGSVLELLQSSSLRYQMLFEDETADADTAHTPVLVELGQAGPSGLGNEAQAFLETLLRSGWGRSWGIFCTSSAPFDDVLGHFRSCLPVRSKEDHPLYLRIYEPRLLRALLPTCEPRELNAIFGPVISYLVEAGRWDTMQAFSRGADGLIAAQVSLADQVSQAQAG